MIDLTQIRSDLGDLAVKAREVEVFGDREVGALLQSYAALLLTVTEAVEELQRRHDFEHGMEPLPPLADLANDLLRNIARVPNEVPAFPSRWSFEPGERKAG